MKLAYLPIIILISLNCAAKTSIKSLCETSANITLQGALEFHKDKHMGFDEYRKSEVGRMILKYTKSLSSNEKDKTVAIYYKASKSLYKLSIIDSDWVDALNDSITNCILTK